MKVEENPKEVLEKQNYLEKNWVKLKILDHEG